VGDNIFARAGVRIFFALVILILLTWVYIVKPHYRLKTFTSTDGTVTFEYVEKLVKAPAGKELPLVIVFHDEKYSLRKIVATLSKVKSPCRIIAFKGFIDEGESKDGGYVEADSERTLPQAVETVAQQIKALMNIYPVKGKPILYGFAQGGNVAGLLGLEYPEIISHVLIAGGLIPPTLLPKKNLFWVDYPTFTLYHGQRDRHYIIFTARATYDASKERQIDVVINEYNEIHKLTFEMRNTISEKINELCNSL